MDDIEIGPIDYLVIEWPADSPPSGEALPLLVDLVDRRLIRVLDLTFLHKAVDGKVIGMDLHDFTDDDSFGVFEGATSGLLDDEDREEAAKALDAGTSAAILLYENTWAAPFASALRRSGAQLVAAGRVPVNALVAALDETEDREASKVGR